MKLLEYKLFEDYMHKCMNDMAHDREHIYRVLYNALDIASFEDNVDYDVLITSCLLHDIGRQEQLENPKLCHAEVGSEKAYNFIVKNNFSPDFAEKVKNCILCHRFGTNHSPVTIEEKILFDADKIDVAGTLGIARTIHYKGQINEPLYSLKPDGEVSDGVDDKNPSFFQEYKYKLERLYTKFYTQRGKEIALKRQQSAEDFYNNMFKEVGQSYNKGLEFLSNKLDN